MAVDQFQNTGIPLAESLQGLLDAYIAELKLKRQKLREKRKPSKTNNPTGGNQTAGDLIDDEDFGAEDECEEDDDDDDNDYDYIEDKLLSQNSTSVVGGGGPPGSSAVTVPGTGAGASTVVPSATSDPLKQSNATSQQNQALQNLLNGDSADKSVKKQRVWKKDMLRMDDFSKMKEMVQRLRKHRVNEAKGNNSEPTTAGSQNAGGAAGGSKGGAVGQSGKSIPARTSIQQTQGSNNLIKKETANRRSYLNK